jgi:hypothetical protein
MVSKEADSYVTLQTTQDVGDVNITFKEAGINFMLWKGGAADNATEDISRYVVLEDFDLRWRFTDDLSLWTNITEGDEQGSECRESNFNLSEQHLK